MKYYIFLTSLAVNNREKNGNVKRFEIVRLWHRPEIDRQDR